MKTFFSLFLASALLVLTPAEARSVHKKVNVDSLLQAAVEHSIHGRFTESNADFNSLLNDCKLRRKSKAMVENLYIESMFRGLDYKGCYNLMVKSVGKRRADKNEMIRSLALQPVSYLKRPERDVVIPFDTDSVFSNNEYRGKLITLPTVINGKEERMIFDNGCTLMCTSSNTFAREHNIRPIGANIEIASITTDLTAWIGIADSIVIGDLVFKNVLFNVSPDDAYGKEIPRKAVLGSNIFYMMGEMVFDNKNKTISLPWNQDCRESNLTMQGSGRHFVEVEIGEDTMQMHFDLGTVSTNLNKNYFDKHKEMILSNGTAQTSSYGGIGGSKTATSYELKDITLKSCGGEYQRKTMRVNPEKKLKYDFDCGQLGNDFLLSFERVILNLRNMYLYIEK